MSPPIIIDPVPVDVFAGPPGPPGPPGPAGGDWDDITGKPEFGTAAMVNIHVGSAPPANPAIGDIWIDTS